MLESAEINSEDLYLNIPQMRVLLADPKELYFHAGRRLGKSTEVIAHLTAKRVHDMPRASFLMMGRTYKQVLTRTLPGTIKGWNKRGYHEGTHYVIGTRPPANWPKAMNAPVKDWTHFISWYTGAGFHIGSQDRAGLVNSLTVWGIFGDESKLLLEERFKEDAMPTNSGETHIFKDCPHNRTVVLTSSMPSMPEGKWLFDMEKRMNVKQIEAILKVAIYIEEIKAEAAKPEIQHYPQALKEKTYKYFASKLAKYTKVLRTLRHNSVMYEEASTIANVQILGTDYIKQQKATLKNFFKPEILSIRSATAEDNFYNTISSNNFYTDVDYSHYDKFSYKTVQVNSLGDRDCVKSKPLIIGMDFGAKFNCIITAQRFDSINTLKFINNHYAGQHKLVDDVVRDWCKYYQYHPTREVIFHHDRTGNNRTGLDKETYAERVMRILRSHNWEVSQRTEGGANPRHLEKYLLWNLSLPGKDTKYPFILFNLENCEQLKISMENSKTIDKDGVISKDKSIERRQSVPPEDATHLSDAADTIIYGEYYNTLDECNLDYAGVIIR